VKIIKTLKAVSERQRRGYVFQHIGSNYLSNCTVTPLGMLVCCKTNISFLESQMFTYIRGFCRSHF